MILAISICAILIRLLLLEVFEVFAASKSALPSSIRLKITSLVVLAKLSLLVLEVLLIGVSMAPAYSGSSSSPMIEH